MFHVWLNPSRVKRSIVSHERKVERIGSEMSLHEYKRSLAFE